MDEFRPKDLTFQQWIVNHMPEHTAPIVEQVLKGIKEELKPAKIAAVGYCYGAKHVTRLLAGEIDVGFTAHPSFVEIEELAAIKGPLSIAAAGMFAPSFCSFCSLVIRGIVDANKNK